MSWVEDLPATLSMSPRTNVGDQLVFEWLLIDGQPVPGAWLEITSAEGRIYQWVDSKGNTRTTERRRCGYKIHGDRVLTPDQHQAFLGRNYPRLTWQEPLPTPVTVWIHSEVHVTIPNVRRIKADVWKPTEIMVRDLRPERLLRQGLPSNSGSTGGESLQGLTAEQIEKAATESAYTSSPTLALSGVDEKIEPEGATSEWKDNGRLERELDRQRARREQEIERQEHAAKANLGRLTKGLTLEQREHQLAAIQKLVQDARRRC